MKKIVLFLSVLCFMIATVSFAADVAPATAPATTVKAEPAKTDKKEVKKAKKAKKAKKTKAAKVEVKK